MEEANLLDEVVQILWDFRCQSTSLEDTKDLVARDETDLGNAVGITQYDADLRRGHASTGEFVDLFNDFGGGGLEPGGRTTGVGQGRGRNALSGRVHTT